MALVKEYFELTKKYQMQYGQNTLVLMQVGAFFEVYGSVPSQGIPLVPLEGTLEGTLERTSLCQLGNNINKETGEQGACGIPCESVPPLKSQIYEFAQICDLNIGEKKTAGDEQIIMAGFSLYMIDKYVKKMQDAGYTIVIYEQDETKTSRHLTEIYSPGTYFSLDSNVQMTNNIVCIWIQVIFGKSSAKNDKQEKQKMVHVGLANIDIFTGKSSIFEFSEIYVNNPTTFDELERFISINMPSEVIIIYSVSEKEINDIISYANLSLCKSIHKVNLSQEQIGQEQIGQEQPGHILAAKNCEKQTYQKSVLEKFFKISDYASFIQNFYQNVFATQAYIFLLDFIFTHNPYLVNNIQEPIFENVSDRLILANHSLKQLNIIDDTYSGPFSSVEKLLNICYTSMGKRQFTYNLLNPTTNVDYLQKEYDITEYIINHYDSFNYFKQLTQIKDISKISRQIMMRKVQIKTIIQLHYNLILISSIREKTQKDNILEKYLKSRINEYPLISEFCGQLGTYISDHFVLNESNGDIELDETIIKPGVNEELDNKINLLNESREKLEAIQKYMNECICKAEKGKVGEYVKIHETEKNNFSLIATKRRCQILKKLFSETTVNVTLFYKDNSAYGRGKIAPGQLAPGQLAPGQLAPGQLAPGQLAPGHNPLDEKNIQKQFQLTVSTISFETQTASNDAICSTQIKDICKNITLIKINMKELVATVYANIVVKMERFAKEFDTIIQFVSSIDIVYAKATIAKRYKYCKPTLVGVPPTSPHDGPIQRKNAVSNDSNIFLKEGLCGHASISFINAKGLRHCLIEHLQQNELYISNDIFLGKERNDEIPLIKDYHNNEPVNNEPVNNEPVNNSHKNGVLLYGTNAVGKTSFIRSIGIAVIMAQAGLYVPASSFEYCPYKYIFTRILGNDNIFKNLSTFAVEMSELRTILRLADKNSLVLGDELCSGTESISAISIFVAGVKTLNEIGCSFIFATHLHEIINYEEIECTYLKHMAVVYDRATGVLVYDRKLKDGPGDNMYGLEVCRSLNLPESFLSLAHSIRTKYNTKYSSILSLKTSQYNSAKIIGICEICKTSQGTEVHHLQHQKEANEDNIIISKDNTFNKNHLANLLTLCEKCHVEFHKNKNMHKKVKTSKGINIINA
jgi:DNA mismatch repair protein MutS